VPGAGLGALVISPTRELAIQIFEVLKKVGAFHEMSAGLIIGGKDVSQEQERVTRMNMLVCTPGRLLQHMDETYGFECSGLQMLVLDEADRILDMGFSATLSNIIENLPKERQTVLFSATLSKSVKDLARLSLRTPEYISIHESATYQTPTRLQQHYMVVDCSEKLDVLWSFIKTHLKQKTIVFLSSCNQVKFVHEAFCRLRPGIILSALHGKVKQEKRLQVPPPYSALHTRRTRAGDTQLVLLHDTDERLLTAREQHKHALRRSCTHVAGRA
jgi:ATP-dependent RNA helicase DDX10/DBP4